MWLCQFSLVDQKGSDHKWWGWSLLFLPMKECLVCLVLAASFSNDTNTGSVDSFENLDQSNNTDTFDEFRWVFLFTVEWQLFQLTVCLNTDFNCYGSFELSFTDNATTRTYGFVLLISNVLALIVMEINMRSISQLIRGIRRVLQRLLKNYNGIAISTFLILISTPVLPVILDFNLDNSELFTLSFGFYHLDQFCGSSMYYPRFLHNYCYFLLD